MSDDKPPPAWPSLVLALVFAIAAVRACGAEKRRRTAIDPCPDMRAVTIGGTLVVGCR